MKITIITSDTTLENLHRANILYKLLEKNFEIEVISVSSRKDEVELYKEKFVNYKRINFDFGKIVNELTENITGDIVYALKARPSSFGMAMSLKRGLGKKHNKKIPVILDIDAKEVYNCFPYSQNMLKNFVFSIPLFNSPNSFIYTWLLEKRIKFSDNITISSPALQKIYGGTFIPSACDTDFFNGHIYKRDEIREKMGWTDSKVIIFTGSVNRDTDTDTLLKAVKSIDRNNIKLIFASKKSSFLKKLASNHPFISVYDYQPQLNIAKLLSASDIAVLPLKNNITAQNKIPVKLFEYMSSELPVIASDTPDLTNILSNCGFIYSAGKPDSLKENIEKIIDNPDLGKESAKKAREKCTEKYSFNVISKKLTEFIHREMNKLN